MKRSQQAPPPIRVDATWMRLIASPITRRVLWVAFGVLFYLSGLAFTTWLLTPDEFEGGMQWIWVGLFPILLPAFFFVNHYLGCASGDCRVSRRHRIGGRVQSTVFHNRPPGI